MPVIQALSYDPTLKTVTVAGDIATVNLTSIVNQTKGKDLFVIGQTPVTNRVFGNGNTTFTIDTNTTGDDASDVLAVCYQFSSVIASLDNGYIINGVAHFDQPEINNAGPTKRVDNSPLVIGDKWYNTTKRSDWSWNGAYWAETILRSTEPRLTDGVFGASGMYLYQATYGAEQAAELGFVIIESVSVLGYPGQLVQFGNSSNNRTHVFRFYTSGSTNTFHTSPASHLMPAAGYKATIGLATYLQGFSLSTTIVGSPTAYTPPRTIYYRNAIP